MFLKFTQGVVVRNLAERRKGEGECNIICNEVIVSLVEWFVLYNNIDYFSVTINLHLH